MFFAGHVEETDYDSDEEIAEVEACLALPQPTAAAYVTQITVGQAMKSLDWPLWLKAINKEKLKLESYNCWRKATPEEEKLWQEGEASCAPMAIILTRKRRGTYKARAVALGNWWKADEPLTTYSTTVSGVGQRALLTHCAANGMHLQAFDISSAYIRAHIDRLMMIKLPATWVTEAGDHGRRTLVKALYGLPMSGRLWAKTYAKHLTDTGWTECADCPNIWKKVEKDSNGIEHEAFVSVYVDDCLCCSVSEEVTAATVSKLFKHFDGTFIKPDVVHHGGAEYLRCDILGADVQHNRSERKLRIVMTRVIDKMAKKFDVTAGKPRVSPAFEESAPYNDLSPKVDFNFRSAVGSLQWAATAARPDVQFAVGTLARACARECTKAMARCCIRVMRYLVHTRDDGRSYSPGGERDSDAAHREVMEHPENAETKTDVRHELRTYSDSSSASTFLQMKSVAGAVVYFRSMPTAWRSAAMTVRMYSTAEAEYSAAAEAIKFARGLHELRNFLIGDTRGEGPLWVHNRTALLTARHANTDLSDIRSKPRHYALRNLLARDHANRLGFAPTAAMRADAWTKFACHDMTRKLMTMLVIIGIAAGFTR